MSGGKRRAKSIQRFAPAMITSLSSLGDAIVCFRGSGNALQSNVPLLHQRQDCLPDIWPEKNKGSNAYMSASILLEFLINHHQIDQDEVIAELLSQLVPAFTTEFIDVMPDQGGIIPISVISDWLDRNFPSSALSLHVVTGQQADDDHFDWNDWPNVTAIPFARYGFVCTRTDKDKPVYNIRQRIWLRPGLQMDWDRTELARLSLAANVVDEFLWTCSAGKGIELQLKGHIEGIYESFIDDFVRTMPVEGGHIPVSVMRNWLFRHSKTVLGETAC